MIIFVMLSSLCSLGHSTKSTLESSRPKTMSWKDSAALGWALSRCLFEKGPDEAPHITTRNLMSGHVILRSRVFILGRHDDTLKRDCYLDSNLSSLLPIYENYKEMPRPLDFYDPSGMYVVIEKAQASWYRHLLDMSHGFYKSTVELGRKDLNHSEKSYDCAPKALMFALYELSGRTKFKTREKDLEELYKTILGKIKEKQKGNPIVKLMKQASCDFYDVPGSLPCDIVDVVNDLRDEGRPEFKHITAKVYITRRAMDNFPDAMPLLQKYFGAEVVEDIVLAQPVDVSGKGIGEWEEYLEDDIKDIQTGIGNLPEGQEFYTHPGGSLRYKLSSRKPLKSNQRALEWCLNLGLGYNPSCRFYQHIGRYPTEDELEAIKHMSVLWRKNSIGFLAEAMYAYAELGYDENFRSREEYLSLRFPPNRKLFRRTSDSPPRYDMWKLGVAGLFGTTAWRVLANRLMS